MRAELGGMRAELVVATPDADLLVANAARASFDKESALVFLDAQIQSTQVDLAGELDDTTRAKKEKYLCWLRDEDARQWSNGIVTDKLTLKYEDYNLINFLAREKHMLPFRHPHITLRCQAPMFVARQLGKHQVGMSWSEVSRRYIDSEPEFFWPNSWRKRAKNVKQGSSDEEVDFDAAGYAKSAALVALEVYERLLEEGAAPEQARMVLPQNMMITWVWTGSLLAWVHMIKERSHPTAQKETREFAEMVKSIMYDVAPASMQALMEYQ